MSDAIATPPSSASGNADTPPPDSPDTSSAPPFAWRRLMARMRIKRSDKKKKKRAGMPSIATLMAIAILSGALFLRYVDPWAVEIVRVNVFDALNRVLPRPVLPVGKGPVVIADIDEKSLAEIGQWPWPRTVIADMLTALQDYQVAVVGFDMVFGEVDRTSPAQIANDIRGADDTIVAALKELESNESLMAKAMRTVPTVLGQTADNAEEIIAPHSVAEFTSVGSFLATRGVRDADPSPYLFNKSGLVYNLEQLESSASGLGLFSIENEVDGVIRRVPMVMNVSDVIKPALSMEMLRVALRGNSIVTLVNQGGMQEVRLQTPNGNFPVPVDGKGRVWVYYAVPDDFNTPDNSGRLYISAGDIIKKRVPPERLAGKLVLVGTSSAGLLDIRATPISPRLPGVEVHANIIENILTRDFISYPFTMVLWEMIAILLAGMALIFFIPRVGPLWTLGGLAITIGGLMGVSFYLFTEKRTLFDFSYPGAVMATLYGLLIFANYTREAAEKRQVRGAFGQYLSPALVDQLAENPDQLRLGGETKHMTLLFCDVRGFTTISEQYKADPQGLTRLINRLLTPLTNEILSRQGTIDKYMGDCIMAFWNAPLDDPDQEVHACHSAQAMFAALAVLNKEREQEAAEADIPFLPLNIGIGINSGDCVVGNMGSDQRFDYSVLGDAVNLAARLEGQSKSYGVGVVIGMETAAAVRDEFPVAELDQIAVKGKTEAVRIFTIAGPPELRPSPEFEAFSADHNAMLTAYRGQRWEEAEKLIGTCRGKLDGIMDGFYDIYLERIAAYRADPPPADWDGVFVATTK